MFFGSYRHGVDSKGRVAVPAQLRRSLPRGSVIAVGLDGRLVMRTPAQWAELEREHAMRAESSADERRLARQLYSSAREIELDQQGRLLLGEEHRRWAGITDRVVFVGIGNRVELVGAERWDAEFGGLDSAAFTALNDRVLARPAPPASASSPA